MGGAQTEASWETLTRTRCGWGEERPSGARGRADGRMQAGGVSHWGRVGVGRRVGVKYEVWGLRGLLRDPDPKYSLSLGVVEACLALSPHHPS